MCRFRDSWWVLISRSTLFQVVNRVRHTGQGPCKGLPGFRSPGLKNLGPGRTVKTEIWDWVSKFWNPSSGTGTRIKICLRRDTGNQLCGTVYRNWVTSSQGFYQRNRWLRKAWTKFWRYRDSNSRLLDKDITLVR